MTDLISAVTVVVIVNLDVGFDCDEEVDVDVLEWGEELGLDGDGDGVEADGLCAEGCDWAFLICETDGNRPLKAYNVSQPGAKPRAKTNRKFEKRSTGEAKPRSSSAAGAASVASGSPLLRSGGILPTANVALSVGLLGFITTKGVVDDDAVVVVPLTLIDRVAVLVGTTNGVVSEDADEFTDGDADRKDEFEDESADPGGDTGRDAGKEVGVGKEERAPFAT
ncbi:hypothetical protein GP486_000426 [Trichoglossum hirsutum]|uniref:Uncharacterized protein n=1 Tax=Trichoglossum hirsutum TaxID=265104 RepID=A0A9P8RTK4_9PEZI|nr:hypothetical protein GP486_000426 [Trichoglossum hirsutum]